MESRCKFEEWLLKNSKVCKLIWGILLFFVGITYIFKNHTRILNSLLGADKTLDYAIVSGTFILALLPFINEISFLGFSVKRTIHEVKLDTADVKRETKEINKELIDFKYQIQTQLIEIKSTTMQNTNQSVNVAFEYLPSKDQLQQKPVAKESKTKYETEQHPKDTESELLVSNDTIYLFKVRYLLEQILTKSYSTSASNNMKSLISIINVLKSNNTINIDTYEYIKNILNICNRAIHGEIISEEYVNYVKEVFPYVNDKLNEVTKKKAQYLMTCPRCKYSGRSSYENVCPSCGFTSDGE